MWSCGRTTRRRLGAAALLGSLILLALPGGALGAEPGLVGQWHFDATAGTGASATTLDSSGYGGTGYFANTPTLAPGRFASAFNGPVAAEPMMVSGTSGNGSWSLEPGGAVSVTAWVKYTGDPGVLKYIVSKGDFRYLPNGTDCAGGSYAIYTGYNGRPGLTFYVTFANGTSLASPNLTDTSKVFDGQWHAVTGTYDGSNARLYVDGALVPGAQAGASAGAIRYGGSLQQHSEFGVGAYPDHGTCPDNSKFPGAIDEVRVHNRALSGAEIAKLHDPNATTPPDLTPAGGGGGGPPTASFSVPTTAGTALGRTVLDAGATKGASRLLWDLNNDGKIDLDLPASQPNLSLTLPSPRGTTVKLTAVGAGGTSSFTRMINPTGKALSSSLFTQINPPVVAASSASRTIFTNAGLGLSIICAPTTVVFSLVEAQGCFDRINDVTNVPGAERSVVQAHYTSEKVSAVVTSICNQAAAGKLPQSKCDEAKKFFPDKQLDVYVSDGTVKINGLQVTPRSGAHVVVYPSLQRVISSNATLKWGSFTIQSGTIDMDLRNSTVKVTGKAAQSNAIPEGKAQLLYFDAAKTVPSIGGFQLNGTVELDLQGVGGRRSSTGTVHLQLPPVFSIFGGSPPTADVQLVADNTNGGPVLDNLDMRVPEAYLGAVWFTDLRFAYSLHGHIDGDFNEGTSCSSKEWKAQGNMFIAGGNPQTGNAGFMLTPPPSQNGVGFCAGNFKHAGGAIVFGGPIPQPQIFPGVFLTDINAAVQLDPTLVRGGAGVDVGKVAHINGAFLVAFATPSQPYRLTTQDAGGEFQPLAGTLFKSTTIAVGGDVIIKDVPVYGDLRMGNAAAMYSYPDFFAFAGGVRVPVPGMSIEGGVNGWAQVGARKFEAAGHVNACIAGLKPFCIGAEGMVGSRGMSACGSFAGLHPGGGLLWGHWPTVWPIDGCKPSRFWEVFTARASADRVSFKVARGEKVKQLKIPGTGGAPNIKITAPGGEVLSTAGTTYARTAHMVALRQDGGQVTWAGVKNGRPGTYTIERLPGSVPIGRLGQTRPGYDTNFTARVTGKGAVRTLHYDARRNAGQTVTFVERGGVQAKILRTAHGGRGSFRFRPAFGTATGRRIVALASIDGAPIPEQTLARYNVARIPKTGKPGRVTLIRRGPSLVVRWTKATGATRYGIMLKGGNAKSWSYTVAASRRSFVIKNVPLTYGGTVSVSARGVTGDWGKPRSATFKRRKLPFTALQTNSRNEKKAK